MYSVKNIVTIVLVVTFICLIYKTKYIENFKNIDKNIIDKIYFINLEKSKDRLSYITSQLNDISIPSERFSAVDGSKLNKEQLIENGILHTDKMMIGAVGCSLSHINLWKKINRSKDKYSLVLEDDIIIDPKFEEKVNGYINQINGDFDILYLGGSNIYGRKISENIIKPEISIDSSTRNTGMYAMLINRRVIPKLLKHSQPIRDNIDQVIKNELHKSIKVYYVYPTLINHNNQFDSMRRVNSNRIPKTRWFLNTQSKITILN